MLKKYRGELYLVAGFSTFAFNGVIVTLALDHISVFRLAQIRACGAFLVLLLFILAKSRRSLIISRREVPILALYGIVGFAAVQLGYLLGIERNLPLSLVLILEYTAPIWIVLWVRFVRKKSVPSTMWLAIFLSLAGLILVAKVWEGFTFDLIGLFGAIGSAFALAVYFLIGESMDSKRPTDVLTVWGLGFASLVWIIALPIWEFPFGIFTETINLQGRFSDYNLPGAVLIAWIIVMGTVVPYLFILGGLRLMSASRASVTGMLEPVLAGVFAWIWLSQSWSAIQLLGGFIVLVGIYIADRTKSAVTAR